ncbi:hypothetical protein BH10ACT1_BH10ACT1_36140 [soil metagenome]
MAMTDGGAPEPADNVPGGSTCPPWLLLLDDPDPHRVMVIGPPDDPAAAWFADRGAEVEVWSQPTSVVAPVDLLVISDAAPAPSRGARGLTALLTACLAACRPTGAVVVPWVLRESGRTELARNGFGTIRPIPPVLVGRNRRRGRGGIVAVTDAQLWTAAENGAEGVPHWLGQLAHGRDWAPGRDGWSLRVPEDYPSQKAVALVTPYAGTPPAAVIKLTRHPRFNARLENEAARLLSLAVQAPDVVERVPSVLETGRVAGMAFVAEQAVAGKPFLEVSRLDERCPLAADAVAAIGDLAGRPGRMVSGAALAARLEEIQEQFEHRHQPLARVSQFLRRQIRTIGEAELPSVVFHGDLGTWNLLAEEGSVRILDWESAEDPGPPVWDLAYFSRSFAVRSGRRRGLDRDRAIGRHLIGTSPLNAAIAGWFATYVERTELAPELVEPLFHTTWLHRASKEAARLRPDQPGHYGPLCTRLVLESDSPGVRRLVAR